MKTIVEIGANRGQDTINLVQQPDSFVYCIEPVPQLFEKLKVKFSENQNIKIFQLAIDNYDGKSNLGLSAPYHGPGTESSYACSSLYEFSDNISETWGNRPDFKMTEYVEVEVMKLSTFIEKENIEVIDYLHCDAQSSDLNVLKSLGDKIKILQSGRCEGSNTKKLYKNIDNSVGSILEFLEENNFEITELKDELGNKIENPEYGLDSNGKKYLPHSTAEIDIFFKRKG